MTDPDCTLDVAKVELSPAGVSSLAGTAADLAAQGFDRPDRKYLVWVDAYVFCGVATVKPDDRPSPDNANNGDGQPGMVARVDRGCWGGVNPSTEAHELVHLLGGAQPSAPNANDNFHCTDDAEVLCYDDDGVLDGLVWAHGRQVRLRSVCGRCPRAAPRLRARRLLPHAPARRKLSRRSLEHRDEQLPDGRRARLRFGTSEAPHPTAPKPMVVGAIGGGRVPVRLRWSSRDADVVGYWLWKSVDGHRWKFVPVPNPSAPQTVLGLQKGHTYRFLVHAYDAAGNASPAALGPSFSVSVLEDRSPRITYWGRWQHGRRGAASSLGKTKGGKAVARLTFTGRGVAWVSRTGPGGGRARVFVDGRPAGTVSLYSSNTARRAVVFARSWRRDGKHSVAVHPLGATPGTTVDAFVLLR